MTSYAAEPYPWANAWGNQSFHMSLANNVKITLYSEATQNWKLGWKPANRKTWNCQQPFVVANRSLHQRLEGNFTPRQEGGMTQLTVHKGGQLSTTKELHECRGEGV
jgi:hypothetical protein